MKKLAIALVFLLLFVLGDSAQAQMTTSMTIDEIESHIIFFFPQVGILRTSQPNSDIYQAIAIELEGDFFTLPVYYAGTTEDIDYYQVERSDIDDLIYWVE